MWRESSRSVEVNADQRPARFGPAPDNGAPVHVEVASKQNPDFAPMTLAVVGFVTNRVRPRRARRRAKEAEWQPMTNDSDNRLQNEQLNVRTNEQRAVFARYYGIDDDGEVEERETVSIDHAGGLDAVATRCGDNGLEADLLDRVGCYLGRVVNDGSIEWKA